MIAHYIVKHVEGNLRDARKGTEVTVKLSSRRYHAEIVNLLFVNICYFGYIISPFCQLIDRLAL